MRIRYRKTSKHPYSRITTYARYFFYLPKFGGDLPIYLLHTEEELRLSRLSSTLSMDTTHVALEESLKLYLILHSVSTIPNLTDRSNARSLPATLLCELVITASAYIRIGVRLP